MYALFLKSLCITIATLSLLGCNRSDDDKLTLATGPLGGSWYPLGGAIKAAVEAGSAEFKVRVTPGAGIANVKAIDSGKIDLAIGNSVSTVDGIKGKPPFKRPTKNVCNVATFYPQYFQIIALEKSNIVSINDIEGKSLAGQSPGNTAEAITKHILEVNGFSYDDLAQVNFGSYTDSIALMKDGNADVFTLGTMIPSGAVMDLASVRQIKLINIGDSTLSKLRLINPGYSRAYIPKNTYPNQKEQVKTVGYATHLVGRCDLENKIIYDLVASIYKNLDDLGSITTAMSKLTPVKMSINIGVPMHPGASMWYEQNE